MSRVITHTHYKILTLFLKLKKARAELNKERNENGGMEDLLQRMREVVYHGERAAEKKKKEAEEKEKEKNGGKGKEREDDGDENAKKQKMDDAKNEGRDGAAKMEEDDINDYDKEKDR